MRSDDLRLPRAIESDGDYQAIRRALGARTQVLWERGTLVVPVLALTPALIGALRDAATRRALGRGLEAVEDVLSSEERGLAALPAAEADRHGERVSRLILVTHDGAERLYRRVDRLGVTHAPRVLAGLVDCDAATLGGTLYGGDAVVKVVFTAHKTATVAILRALA